jgi:hypothetical protein
MPHLVLGHPRTMSLRATKNGVYGLDSDLKMVAFYVKIGSAPVIAK